jgi:hypothetical protein
MTDLPPWRLGEWVLADDFAKIEQQWAPIRRLLEDDALFALGHPAVSGWSCGQHAGHMVLVAQTIADRIEGNLADPARHKDETPPEVAYRVLTAGGFPRGSAESPADVHPERHAREYFLPLLPTAVASWGNLRERAAQLLGCAARYPHFRLGPLNSTEWVRMCAAHTAHHLAVVRDIAGEEAVL